MPSARKIIYTEADWTAQFEDIIVKISFLLLVVWMAACSPIVPADTPAQLEHTPGAFITLDESLFDGGDFTVEVPDGWRVVKTSTAEAPLEVVFVSPDDALTIRVSRALLSSDTTLDDATLYERDLTWSPRADFQLYLIGRAPQSRAAEFDPIFDRVENSLEFVS